MRGRGRRKAGEPSSKCLSLFDDSGEWLGGSEWWQSCVTAHDQPCLQGLSCLRDRRRAMVAYATGAGRVWCQ
jgi:hypothetical protein